jgi:hypothetical protein
MRFAGLISRNQSGGEKGITASISNGTFFSARTTCTFRTNGEPFTP